MAPRLSSSLVSRWIALTLAASLWSVFDRGWLAGWTALVPSRVWTGEVWRLVTWPFIEGSPVQLVLTCVVIYKFGGELAYRWGDRRLRRFMLEIVLAAAIATCVLVALTRAYYVARLGGWAIADALVIAWARQFPEAPLQLYGVLVLRGRDIVRLTVAVAILYAIYLGPIYMAPELVACAAAAGYPRGWLRR